MKRIWLSIVLFLVLAGHLTKDLLFTILLYFVKIFSLPIIAWETSVLGISEEKE